MTISERNNKLKQFITCLKCEVSGKPCDDNCPTQYEVGNMGEIIENLEAISKVLEQEPFNKIKTEVRDKEMQIIINISKESYANLLKNHRFSSEEIPVVSLAIATGTPLQEGHGKIGDLDKLIRAMKERNNDNGDEPFNAVDRGYDLAFQHMVEESKDCVIIEADKASEGGN